MEIVANNESDVLEEYKEGIRNQVAVRHGKKLHDISEQIMDYFNSKEMPPIIILQIGGQGSGKTDLSMFWLEQSYKTWGIKVGFLGAPDKFITYAKERKMWLDESNPKGWFYKVDEPEETKLGDLFYIDEAVLFYSGKRAGSSQSLDLESALTICRQNDIPTLVNTQRPVGVIKVVRDYAGIIIFRNMQTGYQLLEANLPPIFSDYKKELAKLDVTEAIFLSLCKYLNLGEYDGIGILRDIPEATFWDHDRVGKMWRGAGISKKVKWNSKLDMYKEIANKCIEAGYIPTDKKTDRICRGYIEVTYPELMLKSEDMTRIGHIICLDIDELEKEKEKNKVEIPVPINNFDFKDWFMAKMRANGRTENEITVMDMSYGSVIQDVIAERMGIDQPVVSDILKPLKLDTSLGWWREEYVREKLEDKRDLKKGHNEADAIDKDGIAHSVKLTIESIKRKSMSYDDLRPEYEYTVANGKDHFIVDFFAWCWKIKEQYALMYIKDGLKSVTFKNKK